MPAPCLRSGQRPAPADPGWRRAQANELLAKDTYTIRSLDDLRALGPVLGKPDGPILLDCKVNADIAAPFMGEFAEFEARQHG